MSEELITQNKSGTHKITHHLILVMKSWIRDVQQDKRNILIAEALNYCVYHDFFKIKGYLITEKRLCLIVTTAYTTLQKALEVFAVELDKKIYVTEHHKEVKLIDTSYIFQKLFFSVPLYNPYIIKLITGKQIRLPYYEPNVVKLEKMIHDYNYCSAIDYRGAVGPVVVEIDKKQDYENI